MDHLDVFVFLGMGAIAFFSFLSVATWADNRRREREVYYGNETLRKIMEMPGASPAAVQDFVREQQAGVTRRRREGLKLGGMVLIGVGVGITLFLGAAPGPAPLHVVGMIPAMIGLAMLIYVYFMSPKVG